MSILKENKSNFLFLCFVIVVFFVNAYNLTINIPPTNIHQWRQSDCLSIAKNFYEEGNSILEPKIHWQGTIGGHAAGEMPIVNYTVAQLWKVFGQSFGVYRLFNYLIFIAALFVLFTSFKGFKTPRLVNFFFITILLSSPLLTYYSFNFIADVPALSLAIISFSLFFKFYESKKQYLFYLAVFFASMAVLLKASAIVSLTIIIGISILDLLNLSSRFKLEKLFTNKLWPLLSIIAGPILIYSWYSYASAYNLKYNSGVFLIGVLPLWEMNENEIITNATGLFNDQFSIFFNRPMLFLFFMALIYVLCNFKKLSPFLKISFAISLFFFIAFIVFFFRVFDYHDYYLTNLMLCPVITMFCMLHILSVNDFSLSGSKWLVTAICVCILFNTIHSAAVYRLRSIKDDKLCHWYPFISASDRLHFGYHLERHNKVVIPLSELTPELRKIGIKREDYFLSVPDLSPNSTLLLVDQKGFILNEDEFKTDTTWMQRINYLDCKYLLMNDTMCTKTKSFESMKPNLELKIQKQGIRVYQIRKN